MVANMKLKLISFVLLILLVSPVLAVSQTVSFTQDAVWTCPSDVNSISLKMIGAGAGGLGGYYWNTNISWFTQGNGAGGNNGTYLSVNYIPVTPGQTYIINVGVPGTGAAGIHMTAAPDSGFSSSTQGNAGESTTAFGYTAAGGAPSYENWTAGTSGSPFPTISLSHDPIGGNGYGSYQIASSGANGVTSPTSSTLATSYGSIGGIGYGAGGGGGGAGAGWPGIIGGTGGNGAYGYVEITYDSASTIVVPNGYVVDAYTSLVISGAVVNVTQSGITYSTSSGVDGSFSINNASLTYGIPLTITANSSGYADDTNTFTPLASGPINLTISMIPFSYYTNTTIVGIVRDSLYGNPIPDAVYSAQDTTTSTIYTDVSNGRGFAIVTGLNPDHFYFVWANKTGYTSPSQVLVKPYS